jgi:hypothetical protein
MMASDDAAERKPDGRCMDCLAEITFVTPDEYYMVHDAVWLRANPKGDGKLCVGCLELRLGRRLKPRDFIGCPANRRFGAMSERLRSRITGT